MFKLTFTFLSLSILITSAYSQCTLNVTPNTTQNIVCGEPVDILMQGYSQGPVLQEDFNSQSLGAGWTSSQQLLYTNPCGPTLDGTPAAWMGSNAPQPRTLETTDFDLSCGAQICFDLDFAEDDPCGGCNDCEDPDYFDEGVYFQYSTDGGTTWNDIFYFEPVSGTAQNGHPYYSWANYCFDLPPGGWSPNTKLRWYQQDGSLANWDHWGIDNVVIQPFSCGGGNYNYFVNNVLSDNDTTLYPTTSTTVDLMYTNQVDDTCSFPLDINVTQYNVFATSTSNNLTCGDCTSLIVDNLNNPSPLPAYDFDWTPTAGLNDPSLKAPQACPSDTTTYTATMTDPVSGCTGNATVTINVQPLDPGFNYPNYDFCEDAGTQTPTVTGTTGGEFSAVPAGLTIDVATGQIDPSTSTPGTYDVTYEHTSTGCQSDSTVTITVNALPVVDAGLDTAICSGESVTLTATGAQNYAWDNGVVNGQSFVPTATQTYTVIGTTAANCQATDQVEVQIIPADDPSFVYPDGLEYCPEFADPVANITGTNGGTFSYTALGAGTTLFLDNNTGGIDVSSSDPGNYGIEYVTSGSCPDSMTTEIIIHPSPDANFSANELIGCEPKEIEFIADQQSGIKSANWEFGDGQSSNDVYTTTNTYMGGIYDVTHTVVSANGCKSSETYAEYIDITIFPEADFYPNPTETNIEFTDITFNNFSENSDSYIWDFDYEGVQSTEVEPKFTYPEVPDNYEVQLVAISDDGMCADTTERTIIINDVIIFYVPNTFTPNADEFNNRFTPAFTSGIDIYDFHMVIYNRWGEVIFETYDPSSGWDGHYGDGGVVPDGVYIWHVDFKETASDKRYEHRGHVTVIK